MSEDNPFDPLHNTTCYPVSDYHTWQLNGSGNWPPLANWLNSTTNYQQYNLCNNSNICKGGSNYQPFNGRWVYIFTQIPSDYADPSVYGSAGPNPGWWYVQYLNVSNSGSVPTDRTTWEVTVVDTPPHLIK